MNVILPNVVFAILVFSTLFHYMSIAGIRLIAVPVVLVSLFLFFSFNSRSIKFPASLIFALLMIFYLLALSILSGAIVVFLSCIIFYLFCYWPVFVKRSVFKRITPDFLPRVYLYCALIFCCGLFVQFFLFKFYGIEFGKIDFYSGRTGFGFTWLDYSFASIFLVSAVPLCGLVFPKLKYLVVLTLVVGSVMTTARSGIVALLIFYTAWLFIYSYKALLYYRISRAFSIAVVAVFPGLTVVIIFLSQVLVTRNFSVSGSGRIEGYIQALNYWSNNIFFGTMGDVDFYKAFVGVIPHNLFIYITTILGLVGLIVFVAWLSLSIFEIYRVDRYMSQSFIISIVGLQFVPSIYSAYFIAVIFGISLACYYARTSKVVIS